jgi:hypothetical protein
MRYPPGIGLVEIENVFFAHVGGSQTQTVHPQPVSGRSSVPLTDVRRCLISEREVMVSANSAIADRLRVNALWAGASDPTHSRDRLVLWDEWMA